MVFPGFAERKRMNKRLEIIIGFIRDNHSKFVMILLTVALLEYVAKFPYFSVFLMYPYPWNSMIIIWGMTAILFRLDEQFSFGTALALLCVILILSLLGKVNLVETLGNGVYGLLLLGFVQIAARYIIRHKV